jgi:hypothetical protein
MCFFPGLIILMMVSVWREKIILRCAENLVMAYQFLNAMLCSHLLTVLQVATKYNTLHQGSRCEGEKQKRQNSILKPGVQT